MNKQQNVFQVPENPGQVYNMNLDWKFFKPEDHTWPPAAAYAGAADSKGRQFYEIDYDDQDWEDVSLPHTFNDRDSFRSVANDSGDVGIYRGFAFYRKHFTLPQEHAGKKSLSNLKASVRRPMSILTEPWPAIMKQG